MNLSRVHPTLRAVARNLPRVAAKYNFQVRVTSGYRSRALQTKLYNDYMAGRSHYPASPPGYSAHEKGLALDILSTNTNQLVALLTSIGLQWAGPDDPIHFQIASKTATGAPTTQKVPLPRSKGESTLGKVLDWTAWIPGPIGWGSMIADIFVK